MKQLKELETLGMKVNKQHQVAYGKIHDYLVTVRFSPEQRQYTIMASLKPTGEDSLAQYLEGKEKGEFINWMVYKDHVLAVNVRNHRKLTVDELMSIMRDITYYAKINGYVECCHRCQEEVDISVCMVNGQVDLLCPSCLAELSTNQPPLKNVNLPLGIVGAFIGSLIGVIVWVIIYKLGFIAGISGFVMAVCCYKGYELLGGRIDKKGVWIALIIAIIMLAVAEMVCLGLEIYDVYSYYYDLSIFDSMSLVPEFLKESEIMGSVIQDLLFGYVFMIAASFSYIRSVLKTASTLGVVERLQ